jgi:NADH:ubiquinone oxidoreductase subunit
MIKYFISGSFYTFFRTDDLKNGTVVGKDKYGNTYYENNRYFVGRNRWVIYNDNVYLDYDGSQVPAEWYGWLHYKTDLPPTVVNFQLSHLVISITRLERCWYIKF